METFDHDGLFLNKALITIIVIYLFYMRDQLSKAFLHVQTVSFLFNKGSFSRLICEFRSFQFMIMVKKMSLFVEMHIHLICEVSLCIFQVILQEKNEKSLKENLRTMKPIGWMILISDTLHGFIEGITIGAIAMVSISECIRMMVAIACEEFSHKLGKTLRSLLDRISSSSYFRRCCSVTE